ncbi:unnamed protein product, partial [Allacma fusca]
MAPSILIKCRGPAQGRTTTTGRYRFTGESQPTYIIT